MSDQGLVRQNNEDVFDSIPDKYFFILADGMGGHNAGEVAALESVTQVCQVVREIPMASIEQLSQLLRDAVEMANEKIWKMAQRNIQLSGMGTTLSCFILKDEHLIYAHVGDSRLYRFRKCPLKGSVGQLEQLSLDHSLRASLISQEILNEKSSARFPYKNVITKALGTTSPILPDIGILSTLKEDIYLLCTDGLTDLLSDQEISSVLSQEISIKKRVQILINRGLKKGGTDNITVLMVKLNDSTDLSR